MAYSLLEVIFELQILPSSFYSVFIDHSHHAMCHVGHRGQPSFYPVHLQSDMVLAKFCNFMLNSHLVRTCSVNKVLASKDKSWDSFTRAWNLSEQKDILFRPSLYYPAGSYSEVLLDGSSHWEEHQSHSLNRVIEADRHLWSLLLKMCPLQQTMSISACHWYLTTMPF